VLLLSEILLAIRGQQVSLYVRCTYFINVTPLAADSQEIAGLNYATIYLAAEVLSG
jgi:hypothetical protein